MLYIGSHVKYNKEGLLGSVKEACMYGANAFMFYTGAPQNTIRSEINPLIVKEAHELMRENNISFENMIVHAPYIVNLANNADESKYVFSQNFLRQELDRVNILGAKYIVLHPGSAVKHDKLTAINNIINALNNILKEDDNVMILLETMAGKGTEIGSKMDEIVSIINGVKLKNKVGVCLDTCHLNDSGIDINSFDEYLDTFDKYIGLDKVKCIHVNDSKNAIGTHKDRHENIGFGTIGFNTLISVIYNERLKDIPKILETPYVEDCAPYKYEIEMIKKREFNPNLKELIIGNK